MIWLMNVMNAIVELEVIPDSLKQGLLVPVYKRGGKDPLRMDSYRGITLTSMVAKVLEFLILGRLHSTLLEIGIPHLNQTAYRKKTSCADAIFATLEVIAEYLNSGSKVLMCLYDLQKAYDSVEYPVLLEKLYEVGINGKLWRLLKNWYLGGRCKVRLDGICSEGFEVERGVKKGSVLSPVLFVIVMDPLLKLLEESSLGLSVNEFYAGGFLHADDIRTLATSNDSIVQQAELVEKFAATNFLKLNVDKCEVIVFGATGGVGPNCEVGGCVLPVSSEGKCLGFWWRWNLLASRCVEENIKKARKAFFSYGSIGAFQGVLNPLSATSVIESCIMPILLYGAENWIMTPEILSKLESFQGELSKRVLCWPRHHSNTAATLAVGMQSMQSRILCIKLSFLQHVLDSECRSVSGQVMQSLCGGVSSSSLVKECLELEDLCGVKCVEEIMVEDRRWGKEMKELVRVVDHSRLLRKCREKAALIVRVEELVGWRRLWDELLVYKSRHLEGLQALSRLMSHHGRGSKPCTLCDITNLTVSVLSHVLLRHNDVLKVQPLPDEDVVLKKLEGMDLSFLTNFIRFKLYNCN